MWNLKLKGEPLQTGHHDKIHWPGLLMEKEGGQRPKIQQLHPPHVKNPGRRKTPRPAQSTDSANWKVSQGDSTATHVNLLYLFCHWLMSFLKAWRHWQFLTLPPYTLPLLNKIIQPDYNSETSYFWTKAMPELTSKDLSRDPLEMHAYQSLHCGTAG